MFHNDVFPFSHSLLLILFIWKIHYIMSQKICHKWNEAHKTTTYEPNTEELSTNYTAAHILQTSLWQWISLALLLILYSFDRNLEACSENTHCPWFNVLTVKNNERSIHARCEVLTTLFIKVHVCRNVMPCQLVNSHQYFGKPFYLHLQRHTVCS
jgi:hypothetical protein